MAEETTKQNNHTPVHFTLSPDQLAKVLFKAIPLTKKEATSEKSLFMEAMTMQIANAALPVMEAESRSRGELEVRQMPATSGVRSAVYEHNLYQLLDAGKVDEVKSLVQPQAYTITTHPNFTLSSKQSLYCKNIIQKLGELSLEDIRKIEKGQIPEVIANALREPLTLDVREKRSRADELKETVLEEIPTFMGAATKQIDTLTRRGIGKINFQDFAFKNVGQLTAAAQILPEINSWFGDGDGKRTAHVYDTEYAIPAIKRATYEEYLKLLHAMPDNMPDFDKSAQIAKFEQTCTLLVKVEKLAKARMEALNKMQDTYEAQIGVVHDNEKQGIYKKACRDAAAACKEYKEFITSSVNQSSVEGVRLPLLEGQSVLGILKQEDARELKGKLSTSLNKLYAEPAEDQEKKYPGKKNAEDLFIKLERYGDYSVKLQRRENAAQYREVFQYLIERDSQIAHAVIADIKKEHPSFEIDPSVGAEAQNELVKGMNDIPALRTAAIKSFTKLAMQKPKNPGELNLVQAAVDKEYRRLANKLEKPTSIKFEGQTSPFGVQPLQARELLALDDLGFFHMASDKYYPQAMSGGYVIAEFGQPDLETLKSGNEELIKSEVVRRCEEDMSLQIAFAHSMGAENHVKNIPLSEDPSTIKYLSCAEGALRSGVLHDFMMKQIGTDAPEARARKKLGSTGQPELLTAYEYLKGFGASDEELLEKHHDIERLKKTYVLESDHRMWACSDVNKRATTVGVLLAEQSVRDCALEAARHSENLDGKNYIIVNPPYFGQGGSFARANGMDRMVRQETLQGAHAASHTPASLALDNHNDLLHRLTMLQESLTYDPKAEQKYHNQVEKLLPGSSRLNMRNIEGQPGYEASPKQRKAIDKTILARISSTRDDTRYNEFLEVYGETVPNHSARPGNKGKASGVNFNEGRAIGIAGMEQGIFSNIIGLAELFKLDSDGNIQKTNLMDMKKWQKESPQMRQILMAAAITVNFVDLEEKWDRGGITFREKNGVPSLLGKKQNGRPALVTLAKLCEVYEDNKKKGKSGYVTNGVTFTDADLVMAHLTEQYYKLKKGLHALQGSASNDDLDLLPKSHRSTIEYMKNIYHRTLQAIGLIDDKNDSKRKLLEGVYYMMMESGNLLPNSALMEPHLELGRAA